MCVSERGVRMFVAVPDPRWESRVDVLMMTVVVPVPVRMRGRLVRVLVLVLRGVQQP